MSIQAILDPLNTKWGPLARLLVYQVRFVVDTGLTIQKDWVSGWGLNGCFQSHGDLRLSSKLNCHLYCREIKGEKLTKLTEIVSELSKKIKSHQKTIKKIIKKKFNSSKKTLIAHIMACASQTTGTSLVKSMYVIIRKTLS